jgi:hypothetical protein
MAPMARPARALSPPSLHAQRPPRPVPRVVSCCAQRRLAAPKGAAHRAGGAGGRRACLVVHRVRGRAAPAPHGQALLPAPLAHLRRHSLDARRVLEQRLLAQPLRLPRLGPHARRPWSHCRPADRAAPGAWNRRRAPRRERSRARRRLRRRLWAVRDAACPPSTRGGTRLVRLVRGRGGAAANLRRARGLRHGACASGRGAGGRGRRGRADFLREARQGVRRARDTRHLRARIRKVSLISSTFQNRS